MSTASRVDNFGRFCVFALWTPLECSFYFWSAKISPHVGLLHSSHVALVFSVLETTDTPATLIQHSDKSPNDVPVPLGPVVAVCICDRSLELLS